MPGPHLIIGILRGPDPETIAIADELAFEDATTLAGRLRSGELGAAEVCEAFLARIERIDPELNAVCTLDADRALETARAADAARAAGAEPGPLHGMPVGIKDTILTAGIRTTFGSPVYADNVPDRDSLHVTRLKAAGAVVLGKTNTPEFAAGSHTFNPVFGVTRNPFEPGLTCGGSSGGSAVALASGMLPLADGTDMGGSLRNPAGYCNVVGFRTSPGRVPAWPTAMSTNRLSVVGPIARSVADAALMLSAMAGPDPRVPLSIEAPGAPFAGPLEHDFDGARIAWSPTLGRYPVDPRVTAVCEGALGAFADLGARVDADDPDLRDADEIFRILRAWTFAARFARDYERHRARFKETLAGNIEQGLALSGTDVARAEVLYTDLRARTADFFERHDFLVCPTAQVPPFPVEVEWIREIDGVKLETYIDWMGVCYAITVTGCPAISVPAGFTPEGLPVGLQIVGPPNRDLDVLRMAHAFEGATGHGRRRPPAAGGPG